MSSIVAPALYAFLYRLLCWMSMNIITIIIFDTFNIDFFCADLPALDNVPVDLLGQVAVAPEPGQVAGDLQPAEQADALNVLHIPNFFLMGSIISMNHPSSH